MWFIPAAMAIGSGIANMISNSNKAKAEKEQRDQAIGTLRSNLIDDKGLNDLLQSNNRMFNNGLISTLNSSAISSRGYANSGVVGAAVAGGIEGKRLEADTNIEQNVQKQNYDINSRISQLQGSPITSEDPTGSFITGAIPGLTAGLELDKMAGSTPATADTTTKTDPLRDTPGQRPTYNDASWENAANNMGPSYSLPRNYDPTGMLGPEPDMTSGRSLSGSLTPTNSNTGRSAAGPLGQYSNVSISSPGLNLNLSNLPGMTAPNTYTKWQNPGYESNEVGANVNYEPPMPIGTTGRTNPYADWLNNNQGRVNRKAFGPNFNF